MPVGIAIIKFMMSEIIILFTFLMSILVSLFHTCSASKSIITNFSIILCSLLVLQLGFYPNIILTLFYCRYASAIERNSEDYDALYNWALVLQVFFQIAKPLNYFLM